MWAFFLCSRFFWSNTVLCIYQILPHHYLAVREKNVLNSNFSNSMNIQWPESGLSTPLLSRSELSSPDTFPAFSVFRSSLLLSILNLACMVFPNWTSALGCSPSNILTPFKKGNITSKDKDRLWGTWLMWSKQIKKLERGTVTVELPEDLPWLSSP